jgi:AcrR family transcriptional regulator
MQAPSLYSYFESKNAIYDAMFAQGARQYLEDEERSPTTGDALADLKSGMRTFVGFCTSDPVRYQLLFQRTIPGFEPSAETFAISLEGMERLRTRLAAIGVTDDRAVDLLTAIGTGLTDQQISNDPGGDRWTRLVDEAMEMFHMHVSRTTTTRKRKGTR